MIGKEKETKYKKKERKERKGDRKKTFENENAHRTQREGEIKVREGVAKKESDRKGEEKKKEIGRWKIKRK